MHTDVIVIGGGPAGSTAAISLLKDSDLSVTLLDRSDLTQQRVGESVSPSIHQLLEYLGLSKENFGSDCFMDSLMLTSYWGAAHPTTHYAINSPQKPNCQLDRLDFDLTLLKKVDELGGIVLPRTKCISIRNRPGNDWHITAEHAEKGKIEINARFIIDASGRNRGISKLLSIPSTKHDQLCGIGAFFEADHGGLRQQMLETNEYGWWYLAVLPGGQAAITLFTDADIAAKLRFNETSNWCSLLKETKFLKKELPDYDTHQNKLWSKSAHSHLADVTKCENFLAIGDAMAAFDPVSSMGIGFAMTSACNAAKIVALQLEKPDPHRMNTYQKDVNGIFDHHIQIKNSTYKRENRWKNSLFWQRRHNS